MQGYIGRLLGVDLARSIAQNPITAVIGPRQCGKSTLVRHILESHKNALFLDLELPSDLRKLNLS